VACKLSAARCDHCSNSRRQDDLLTLRISKATLVRNHFKEDMMKFIVLTLVIGIVATALCASGQQAPAQKSIVWQYAQLSSMSVGDEEADNFIEDQQRFDGKTLVELYTKIAGKAPSKTGELSYLDILNLVGKDGWELVQVVKGEAGTIFYFKRPAP
jgi:hypothetical protein